MFVRSPARVRPVLCNSCLKPPRIWSPDRCNIKENISGGVAHTWRGSARKFMETSRLVAAAYLAGEDVLSGAGFSIGIRKL